LKYYLGTYQLIRLKPLDFGKFKGQKVLTGTKCINESYDAWSLSWTEDGKSDLSDLESTFNITKFQIKEIQEWSDVKFNEKHLGWVGTFNDIDTIREYKNKFFEMETDFEVIGIYFPESSIQDFINEFTPKTKGAEIGILNTINTFTSELEDVEEFVGYDLIGVEFSGDYHSFHCYAGSDGLVQKFGLTLNGYGLINEFENKQDVLEYVNNTDESGFPFVPWYLVKVKKVDIK